MLCDVHYIRPWTCRLQSMYTVLCTRCTVTHTHLFSAHRTTGIHDCRSWRCRISGKHEIAFWINDNKWEWIRSRLRKWRYEALEVISADGATFSSATATTTFEPNDASLFVPRYQYQYDYEVWAWVMLLHRSFVQLCCIFNLCYLIKFGNDTALIAVRYYMCSVVSMCLLSVTSMHKNITHTCGFRTLYFLPKICREARELECIIYMCVVCYLFYIFILLSLLACGWR